MIPGANILNMATRVIAQQTFYYSMFMSRAVNSLGYDIAQYAPAVTVKGIVQPIPRTLYQNMGLDFQKNFYNFFLPQDIIDIARDVSGDQFTFNGGTYQCLSKTNWSAIDGWVQVLTVEVT